MILCVFLALSSRQFFLPLFDHFLLVSDIFQGTVIKFFSFFFFFIDYHRLVLVKENVVQQYTTTIIRWYTTFLNSVDLIL